MKRITPICYLFARRANAKTGFKRGRNSKRLDPRQKKIFVNCGAIVSKLIKNFQVSQTLIVCNGEEWEIFETVIYTVKSIVSNFELNDPL